MEQATRVTDQPCAVGESPLWHAGEAALYWVDIPAGAILRLDAATGRVDRWELGEPVGCIAFGDGALVAGMQTGIHALRLERGGVVRTRLLAAPAMPLPGMRFNDGRCDRQGRFWAGTIAPADAAAHAAGKLYRFDATHGLSAPVIDGLVGQNGLAWSPDGRTMYLSDAHASRRLVWAFDFDVGSGAPSGRRVFVDMNLHPGRPDGAAIDVDGCYWCAAVDGGRLLRFTPQGRLDREILLPVAKPSMCAFGGAGLDVLYVTTIRPRDASPDAGDGWVYAIKAGIAGCPEPRFAGAPWNHEEKGK